MLGKCSSTGQIIKLDDLLDDSSQRQDSHQRRNLPHAETSRVSKQAHLWQKERSSISRSGQLLASASMAASVIFEHQANEMLLSLGQQAAMSSTPMSVT